jgi:hypothetical protein
MTAIMTPRTAIRLVVRDLLLASLPEWDDRITERRVSMNRATPLFAAKLPAVLIYAGDERIEESPHADPGLRHRKLDLVVEVVSGGEGADETAEKLAFAVETILEHDETLGELVEGSKLKSVDTEVDGDGEVPLVGVRLSFEVSYWTRPLYLFAENAEQQVVVRPPVPVEGQILGMTPGFGEKSEPAPPTDVLASFEPETGPDHEQDYKPVDEVLDE